MGMYKQEEMEIDMKEIITLIKSKLWLIVLSGTIVALAAGLYSNYMITPIYTSKTQLYILSRSTSTTSLADIQVGTQLTQDYMILIKSRPVVNKVIENLFLHTSYEELIGNISVSNPNNTRILEIKIDHPNAYLAKRIADEVANVATEYIANIMATEKPSIINEGNLPTEPSSPNIKMNTIIGGMLGILLAAGIIIFLFVMDDRIKDSDDIEKYLGLSTLGLIPIDNGKIGKGSKEKPNKKSPKNITNMKGKR